LQLPSNMFHTLDGILITLLSRDTFLLLVIKYLYRYVILLLRMASNCNGKKWSAKVAGEQSIELFLALYLGMNGSMKEEAVVISVMDYSLDVLVLSTGSNHRVYTNVRKNVI
jgi:DIS3-like exonuclease 2 C terminal